MAKLESELEVTCPCCRSTLVVDLNLGRVVAHREAGLGAQGRADRRAQAALAEEAAATRGGVRAVGPAERTRGDALSRRFEEALRQAKDEPITKPTRDFDLD